MVVSLLVNVPLPRLNRGVLPVPQSSSDPLICREMSVRDPFSVITNIEHPLPKWQASVTLNLEKVTDPLLRENTLLVDENVLGIEYVTVLALDSLMTWTVDAAKSTGSVLAA